MILRAFSNPDAFILAHLVTFTHPLYPAIIIIANSHILAQTLPFANLFPFPDPAAFTVDPTRDPLPDLLADGCSLAVTLVVESFTASVASHILTIPLQGAAPTADFAPGNHIDHGAAQTTTTGTKLAARVATRKNRTAIV